MPSSRELGQAGEDAAVRFLEDKGFRILERNARTKAGEIDLVARDGDSIVFVEVKSRSSDRFGAPSEAVDSRKLSRLVRAAELYLLGKRAHNAAWRIDVVSILWKEGGVADVEHLPNVTG